MVKNPFITKEFSNPEITDAVTAAYNQNVVDGTATDINPTAKNIAEVAAEDARQAGQQAGEDTETKYKFDEITDNEVAEQFEAAFIESEKLFSRIGIEPPTPEEFAESGVDFNRLAKAYRKMQEYGGEPCLVVSPVLILSGSVREGCDWASVYEKLASDSTIPNNPLKGKGLMFEKAVDENQSKLFIDDSLRVQNSFSIHHVMEKLVNPEGTIPWTVSVVPTRKEPYELDSQQRKHEMSINGYDSKHLSISQYLTTQALLVQLELRPIDWSYSTWLQGSFDESGAFFSSPLGYYTPIDLNGNGGEVWISCQPCDHNDPNLGVRLPECG